MDVVLSVISIEMFKALSVVLAALVGVGLVFAFPHKWQWAIFGSVLTFMVTTASVGIYVLMHINDPRWSAGRDPLVQAPSFSDTPVVGQYLDPLDGFLNNTAASINEITAFRHAVPVANEFFGLAGWAFLVLIVVTIAAILISKFQPSPEKREIRQLREELSEVKRYVGMPPDSRGH